MKIIPVLILWLTSAALAEDFTTVNGKQYKNAAVIRVEPDGIVLKMKSGIAKLYFVELPKEVQERFHYNPANAAQFSATTETATAQTNAAAAAEKAEQEAQQESLLHAPKYRIQGYVRRKTSDGLVVELFALVSHNASDVPLGIHNPIGDAEWRGFKVVLLRGYPGQENVADGDYVDAVAYDSGPSPTGASTYRSYTFYSR